MNATTFALLFIAFLVTGLVLRLWLAYRQISFVSRHQDHVPDAFANDIPAEAHQKAANYTAARTRFGMISTVWGIAILLFWTLGGGIEMLDTWWSARINSPLLVGLGVILSVATGSAVLDLPFSVWDQFVIEERFGFNRMSAGLFFADTVKQLLLSILLVTLLAAGVLWVMRATGDYWWLAAWAVWMGFTLVITWAYPRVIAPLFNKFQALEAGPLRERIDALLKRCGFTSRGVFVMDASRRSAHGNAYFTGFGRNKRIVLFDTLRKDLEDEEVEGVLAHELGHFRLRHIPQRLVLMAVFTLFGFMLLSWLARQEWFYAGLGVDTASDHAAILLFVLVAPVFTFFITPIGAWFSRRHEFQADAYAVRHADASALASALVKLYRENATTLTPDPVYSTFYHSHPPALIRIGRLRTQTPNG